ncbi:MAG: hypothetical protein LW599_04020 [Rickettsiaceae bacterium]|jgi:hypothetical protein|nr:hypothetical protein [Rickettsiaceae bacterium]
MSVQNLPNLKIVTQTQVDLLYFNSVVAQVFSQPSIYASIPSDVQCVNQNGSYLFGYYSPANPETQKAWYLALQSSTTQTIEDSNNLIAQVPEGAPKGSDLITILNTLITDCHSIQALIPPLETL